MASANVTSELESAPLRDQQMSRNTHIDSKNCSLWYIGPLLWRHNVRFGVANHQPHDCLLNHSFRHRSKKYQSSASLAFVWIIHWWPMNSQHKGPVTRKMFPFHDVIMFYIGAFVQQVYWRWSIIVSGDGSVQDRRHVVPQPTVICCKLGSIDSRQ